jgi:hypothetical protein
MKKLKKDGTEKRSGGKRPGSGKKQINPLDKLETLSLSIPKKHILNMGGMDSAKMFIKMLFERKFNEAHDIKTLTEQDIIEKAVL